MGTANPVPALFISPNTETDPITEMNMQRIFLWSKQVSPVMLATGASLAGILPIPAAPQNCYLSQGGSQTVTITGGAGTVTFPQPFPNGVLCVLPTLQGSSAAAVTYYIGAVTTVDFVIYVTVAGSAFTGTSTVNFFAIGW